MDKHRKLLVETFEKLDEWEKIMLLLRAFRLLLRRKNVIRVLSRLMISPAGVHLDRRQSSRFHYVHERRLTHILAARLRAWLYDPEPDPEGGGTFIL